MPLRTVNTPRKKADDAKNAKKNGEQRRGRDRAKYNITSGGSRKTIQDSLPSRRRLRTPKLLLFMTDGNTYTCNSRVSHWDDGDSRKSLEHNHETEFRAAKGELGRKGKRRIGNFYVTNSPLYISGDGNLILSSLFYC